MGERSRTENGMLGIAVCVPELETHNCTVSRRSVQKTNRAHPSSKALEDGSVERCRDLHQRTVAVDRAEGRALPVPLDQRRGVLDVLRDPAPDHVLVIVGALDECTAARGAILGGRLPGIGLATAFADSPGQNAL